MGMTIEESINGIEKRILPIYDNDADHEALVTAIETMRKYQKIQEIVKNTQYLCSYGSAFIDIREVVEDGKNDD